MHLPLYTEYIMWLFLLFYFHVIIHQSKSGPLGNSFLHLTNSELSAKWVSGTGLAFEDTKGIWQDPSIWGAKLPGKSRIGVREGEVKAAQKE
jgi:hypothetical protein